MRLDVAQRQARIPGETSQGAYLIEAQRINVRLRHRLLEPAEVLAIGVTWMRPYLNPMPGSEQQRLVGRRHTPSMEAAGNVGRADQGHELVVGAATLAQIAVQIDVHAGTIYCCRRCDWSDCNGCTAFAERSGYAE
jgi:hypothetical protein